MVGGRALDPLAKMSRAHEEARYALPPTDSLTPGDCRKDVVMQDLTPGAAEADSPAGPVVICMA
jgi:hypothetical protein